MQRIAPANVLKTCARCSKGTRRMLRTQPHRGTGPRTARKREVVLRKAGPSAITAAQDSAAASDGRRDPLSPQPPPSSPYANYDAGPSGPIPSIARTALEDSPAARMPVEVTEDPDGLIPADHPAAEVLSNSGLVVVRQLEMMNVFLGYEQANRYSILSPDGRTLAYLAEEEAGFGRSIGRQIMRSHRPFRCTVMDPSGQVLFRISRPFAFINSRVYVSLGDDESNIVGEAVQEWHPWRRRYNLYWKRPEGLSQFAKIDEGFLSWDFNAKDENGRLMASITKNFTGFGRELFTDTSQYAIKFDAVDLPDAPSAESSDSKALVPVHHGLTLDQRAILLAAAFTTDVDYFSRKSGGISGFPMMFPMPFPSNESPGATPAPEDLEGDPPASATDELPRSPSADQRWEGSSSTPDERPYYPQEAPQSAWDETPLSEGEVLQDPWAGEQHESTWFVDDDSFGDSSDGDGW